MSSPNRLSAKVHKLRQYYINSLQRVCGRRGPRRGNSLPELWMDNFNVDIGFNINYYTILFMTKQIFTGIVICIKMHATDEINLALISTGNVI